MLSSFKLDWSCLFGRITNEPRLYPFLAMVDFTLGISTILVCKSIETDRGKLNFIFNSPTWLITHNLRLNQFVFYHWNQESNFSEPKQEKTAMLFPRSWLQTGTSPLEEKDFTVELKYCSLCGSHSWDKNLNHVLIWVIQIFFSFLVFNPPYAGTPCYFCEIFFIC